MTITARSTPYRITTGTRTCGYCGVTKKTHTTIPDYYCIACVGLAKQLGWLTDDRKTCTNCTRPVRWDDRDLCGTCTWNTKGRKNG